MIKKACERCGKLEYMLPWESLCYQCMKEKAVEEIQEAIREGENVDTSSSDYIICPYCGRAYDICCECEDFPLYEEGCHDIQCEECGKVFYMTTNISFDYETERIDE